MTSSLRHLPHTALIAALVFSACTGSSVEDAADSVETSTSLAPTTETTSAPEPTTTETSIGVTPPESMPGDVIEFGPREGDEIAVVGVAFDDTLNVRVAPGIGFDVIETLPPDANMTAGGENRLLTDSFWVEIESGDGKGWVNEAFVGFLGVTRDIDLSTVDVVPAATAEGFGFSLAETFASTDPVSTIALVDIADTVVTLDVLGLGDDALKGLRLTVATTEIDEGFTISGLQEQAICSRGLTTDLKCV